MILIGHSAGGYNVLMAGLASQYLATENVELCKHIAGVIGLAAPSGALPATKEPTITIFPDRLIKQDAPLNNAADPSPPALLVHGGKDTTVYPINSKRLAEVINARGGTAQHIEYPSYNHIDPIRLLSRFFADGSTLKKNIVEFINQQSMKKSDYCL